jgi:hypothetical protein
MDGQPPDFDERSGCNKGCNLYGAACRFVRLFGCSKIFRVSGIHAGEVELVLHRRIGRHVDTHHDDVAHAETLFLQQCLDLGERAFGLSLRGAVDSRNTFCPIRGRHRRGQLPAHVKHVANPDAGGDAGLLVLDTPHGLRLCRCDACSGAK